MSMPSQQFGKQEELGVPPPARSAPAKSEERVAYLFLMPWFAGLLFFLADTSGVLAVHQHDRQASHQPRRRELYRSRKLRLHVHEGRVLLQVAVHHDEVDLADNAAVHDRRAGDLAAAEPEVCGMHVFRTILYIPAVLSGVAVAVLWLLLLTPSSGP